eukprot:CAMPEP_0176163406 /NCGR_PEP_ID=MMETSP0120_2-20121206/83600_1 /TAXON_ID=160619 /ORGANISM="Kryptoperidinium foliaceum, Strain CCMP 1326" /LENGTH=111 /DNA_ID=CAMNT_0017500933 /DNA_START=333 /DNA_END=669 /DNA_ORIENTATION=-
MKLNSWCIGAVTVETITEQPMSHSTAFVEAPTLATARAPGPTARATGRWRCGAGAWPPDLVHLVQLQPDALAFLDGGEGDHRVVVGHLRVPRLRAIGEARLAQRRAPTRDQ